VDNPGGSKSDIHGKESKMSTAFRFVTGMSLVIALLLAGETLAQPKPKSVPGTGQPAFTQPYYPYGYNYRYSYPYRSYYGGPYRSVPGTGIPYSVPGTGVPAYPPPVYPTWRLGITGFDWPGVGVRIASIEPGGPAERMGIEVTDVIVQINGRPIRSMYDLRNAVAYSGGHVRVLVLDNRTNSYMWHNGSLFEEPVAAPAVPGAAVPGAAVPGAAAPGPAVPEAESPMTPMPMPATPGTPATPAPGTPTPGSGS
jgi:hypothetical protein